MQIPIIAGIYADTGSPDFRTAYPRNMIPVPKAQGISNGYLRQADGIELGGEGPGTDRGGIRWNSELYRVMGTKLCRISANNSVAVLGDVGGGGAVTMDYGFDRLAIASGGRLYYWNGVDLSQVTDPDLGQALSVKWIAGYFMTTDGTHIVVTDLADPASVQTLNYGSAEADPDPIWAVDMLRNEAYAFGRYTIEVFQNVGGEGFPFQRIQGAQVGKGIMGSRSYASLGDTFVFLGSGRGEAPGVYQMTPGNVQKISTREIDRVLRGYTEDQLSGVVVEATVDKGHQHVYVHLPDQCLVYDTVGSAVIGDPLWFALTSSIVGLGTYRARNMVWCYDRWNVGDPTTSLFGCLTDDKCSHFGSTVGWEFSTQVVYANGNGAIVHDLELVCLSGKAEVGAKPVVWTQYSTDGQTWSQERAVSVGKTGERLKRIAWRNQGHLRHWRIQRFRGASDARLAVARLEAQLEPLATK
jgi:hypothetical protein